MQGIAGRCRDVVLKRLLDPVFFTEGTINFQGFRVVAPLIPNKLGKGRRNEKLLGKDSASSALNPQ